MDYGPPIRLKRSPFVKSPPTVTKLKRGGTGKQGNNGSGPKRTRTFPRAVRDPKNGKHLPWPPRGKPIWTLIMTHLFMRCGRQMGDRALQKREAVKRWQRRHPEAARTHQRDATRRKRARKYGYAAAPRERDCPPRPAPGDPCQCCMLPTKNFCMDHDHVTGAFRGWTCHGCNNGGGIVDDVGKLQMRIEFLNRTQNV